MHMSEYEGWYTLVMMIIFTGIVLWAWSGKRERRFSEAANLPFDEPEFPRADQKKVDKNIKETDHE